MTVSELINILSSMPQSATVYTQGGDHRHDFRTFDRVELQERNTFIPAGVYLNGID